MQQDFRNDLTNARKDTNTVLETFAEIKQANAENRRETRRIFLEGFLPKLRKNEVKDAKAKFLLNVYRDSHNGSDEFTAMDAAAGDGFDKRANNPVKPDATANLIGKWSRGNGSGYVAPGGKTQHRVSDEYTFEFLPDGTVEFLFESDLLNLMQCRTTQTIRQRGSYSINGDTLTINLAVGTSVGTGSCDKSANFKKVAEATSILKKFNIRRTDSPLRPSRPLILCFDGQTDEDCFERQSGK